MAVQSTARRAEAPQEAASAAMAKTAPEAEPIAKAAKPARRPRAVAGSRSTKGESSESAGRPAAGESVARNRPASEAGTTPRTSAASPAVARPSQKEPEPQVTPENADPPQQVGRHLHRVAGQKRRLPELHGRHPRPRRSYRPDLRLGLVRRPPGSQRVRRRPRARRRTI